MKKQAVLEFIQNYMQQAMLEIEKSRAQGHLVYSMDVLEKFASEEDFIQAYGVKPNAFNYAYTSSPCLEIKTSEEKWGQKIPLQMCYQLKKDYTASQALDDILYNSTTVIDCLVAVNIAWYMCIRALLIKCYQDSEGNNKFNQLFSQKNRSFILSIYDLYTLTGSSILQSAFSPVPILGYFVKKLHDEDEKYATVTADPCITKGVRVTLFNDPTYGEKYAISHAGAINLVCVGKDAYVGFGLGTLPLTEAQIFEWFAQEFKMPPIEERKPWLASTAKLHLEKRRLNKDPSYSFKAGYNSSISVDFDINNIHQLTHDFPAALNEIDVFIHHYQTQQIIQFRNFYTDNNFNKNDRINIEIIKETIEKLTVGLNLQKDKNIISGYKENIKNLNEELARLVSFYKNFDASITSYQEAIKVQATKKGIAYSQSNLESDKTACLKLLFEVTGATFKFSAKEAIFWLLTDTFKEAQAIKNELKNSNYTFETSLGEIEPPEKHPTAHYRLSIKNFNPATVKKQASLLGPNKNNNTFK